MILDLEGADSQRTISPRLWWILSVASAAVAACVLLVVNALPHEQLARFVTMHGPSVLEQAFANPKPVRLSLELPADIAVPVPPGRIVGDYGPGRPAPVVRAFRLRGSNDSVVVAMAPDAPVVLAPATRPADALAVHGNYAISWMVEPTSLSVVRWTENGMTYEVSSRSLGVRDLARLAEQVR
ncbi:MAG TPA: hypothetical protein VGR46_10460 [Candidatus Limnocylindria bacterium]|nr:hypothetical protein [Candidatus Limnocylindria bacterium]